MKLMVSTAATVLLLQLIFCKHITQQPISHQHQPDYIDVLPNQESDYITVLAGKVSPQQLSKISVRRNSVKQSSLKKNKNHNQQTAIQRKFLVQCLAFYQNKLQGKDDQNNIIKGQLKGKVDCEQYLVRVCKETKLCKIIENNVEKMRNKLKHQQLQRNAQINDEIHKKHSSLLKGSANKQRIAALKKSTSMIEGSNVVLTRMSSTQQAPITPVTPTTKPLNLQKLQQLHKALADSKIPQVPQTEYSYVESHPPNDHQNSPLSPQFSSHPTSQLSPAHLLSPNCDSSGNKKQVFSLFGKSKKNLLGNQNSVQQLCPKSPKSKLFPLGRKSPQTNTFPRLQSMEKEMKQGVSQQPIYQTPTEQPKKKKKSNTPPPLFKSSSKHSIEQQSSMANDQSTMGMHQQSIKNGLPPPPPKPISLRQFKKMPVTGNESEDQIQRMVQDSLKRDEKPADIWKVKAPKLPAVPLSRKPQMLSEVGVYQGVNQDANQGVYQGATEPDYIDVRTHTKDSHSPVPIPQHIHLPQPDYI